MSKTSQALIHVILEPMKKLKTILFERIEHVEDEIQQFNERFMEDRN